MNNAPYKSSKLNPSSVLLRLMDIGCLLIPPVVAISAAGHLPLSRFLGALGVLSALSIAITGRMPSNRATRHLTAKSYAYQGNVRELYSRAFTAVGHVLVGGVGAGMMLVPAAEFVGLGVLTTAVYRSQKSIPSLFQQQACVANLRRGLLGNITPS